MLTNAILIAIVLEAGGVDILVVINQVKRMLMDPFPVILKYF